MEVGGHLQTASMVFKNLGDTRGRYGARPADPIRRLRHQLPRLGPAGDRHCSHRSQRTSLGNEIPVQVIPVDKVCTELFDFAGAAEQRAARTSKIGSVNDTSLI